MPWQSSIDVKNRLLDLAEIKEFSFATGLNVLSDRSRMFDGFIITAITVSPNFDGKAKNPSPNGNG